jgi:hypothetical protein
MSPIGVFKFKLACSKAQRVALYGADATFRPPPRASFGVASQAAWIRVQDLIAEADRRIIDFRGC